MKTLRFVALLVGVSACGGMAPAPSGQQKGKTDSAPASGGKFDFDAILRREISPLPVQKFARDALSGEVEAASAPQIERTKESFKITIPIGTQIPVECYVYNDRTDGASTISGVVKEVKKTIDDVAADCAAVIDQNDVAPCYRYVLEPFAVGSVPDR